MVRTRFALILYFRMVAHKAACHTLSKAFLKSMKTWVIRYLYLKGKTGQEKHGELADVYGSSAPCYA